MSKRRRAWNYIYSGANPKSILGSALILWTRGDLGITIAQGPVTATGTTPPAVTLTGTPAGAQKIEIDITLTGVLGVATFQWKLNGVVQQTGQLTAATFVLGSTGMTANFPAGTYTSDNVYISVATVSAWADQSGHGNNLTQGTAANQPVYQSSAIGALPCLQLSASTAAFMSTTLNVSAMMGAATSGELMLVLQNLADPPAGGNDGGWLNNWGTSGATSHIPFTDGLVYDGTFSNARSNSIAHGMSLANPFFFDVWSATNDFAININGTSLFATASNTVAFLAAQGLLGNGVASAGGSVAELIVANTKMTSNQRNNIRSYVSKRYGFSA